MGGVNRLSDVGIEAGSLIDGSFLELVIGDSYVVIGVDGAVLVEVGSDNLADIEGIFALDGPDSGVGEFAVYSNRVSVVDTAVAVDIAEDYDLE